MLKRIKQIKNIGRFKDCKAACAEFTKMTVIFGRNTYGKSTLTDLLSSIQSGNVDAIKNRKTISNQQTGQQSAKLCFEFSSGGGEIPVEFKGGHWQPSLPNNLKLKIFDDSFIHKNLFVGKQLTRDTKENFSSFILGEQGVRKAQDIADKNKIKNEATRQKNKLMKESFKDINELDQFLSLRSEKTIDILKLEINSLHQEYSELQKRKQNITEIQHRSNLQKVEWDKNEFQDALQNFNNTLKSSLHTYHEDARCKLEEHIKKQQLKIQGAENWIQRGLTIHKGKHCHFCGQILSEDALKLLEIYRQYFDSSYEEHNKDIHEQLTKNSQFLVKERVNSARSTIEKNNTTIANYSELKDLPHKQQITDILNTLYSLFSDWQNDQELLKEQIEKSINQKNLSPHRALDAINAANSTNINQKIFNYLEQYNSVIQIINEKFQEFKQSNSDTSLVQQMKNKEQERTQKERELKRLQLDEPCERYKQLTSTITQLEEEIPRLENELNNEQSQFLDKFFERLNDTFKKFGSQDFTLEKIKDNKGYKPIYYLKVKLRGVDIPENNLEVVFSESDRRALSLALFWASLDGLDETEKSNTIVILDDPVTSFDIHRITTTQREIFSIAKRVKQVILFSHFQYDVSNFLKTYKNNVEPKIKLLSIKNTNGYSTIADEDIEQFIKTEHEQKREEIFNFISKTSDVCDTSGLRVFLETEINLRFAKQIVDNDVREEQFKQRIDKLLEKNIIPDDVSYELHRWRETLNTEHHTYIIDDVENKRSTATRLMDFIYYKLIPKS